MKTILLALAALLSFSCTQAQWGNGKKIKGNGSTTIITRSTSDYDAIHCSGSFDYILVAGTEGKITIEGEGNLLEYIVTEVSGNKLIIKTNNNVNLQPSRNKTIKITIPFKDIDDVSLSGSGDLWNEDLINADSFSTAITGSGDIILNVKTKSIKARVTGSGDLTLKGTTENLDAGVTGSGDFHGFDLNSENTEVSVTGSGDAQVVSTENLKARVSGSGDIKYKGNPKKEDTKVAGSGSIEN
ncbi:head GIN domain-containing protein [Sediminibacter sp. Hel_I_10]|uniref:head GIN domain-containing protein n=1 Tax=Sediminibacter sp. Hel_I_10 TaxID=1392490 RepID=UPI00047975A0|nr:head GIN domain-containing protein [Sediminibacter sp. Hel_I_10]